MYHDDDESPSDFLSPNDNDARHRIVPSPHTDRLDNLERRVERLCGQMNVNEFCDRLRFEWETQQSNSQVVILFQRLHCDAKLPSKSGELEACYDISCVSDDEFYWPKNNLRQEIDYVLKPRCSHVFRTGLACAIPDGYALFLWDRSGLAAKHGIHRLAGVIDCTYRGEILVVLTNLSDKEYYVRPGDRIVQAHLTRVLPSRVAWADELPDSYRQEDGFGSTGK
jgi:dUTP pyrophosphatase